MKSRWKREEIEVEEEWSILTYTSNEWLHFVRIYLLCYGTNTTKQYHTVTLFPISNLIIFLIFLLLILLFFCRHKSIIWLKINNYNKIKSIHRTTWHDSKKACDNISLLLLFASLLLVNIPNILQFLFLFFEISNYS